MTRNKQSERVGVTRGFGGGRMCMLSLLIATVANWSGGIEKLLRIDLCGFSHTAISIPHVESSGRPSVHKLYSKRYTAVYSIRRDMKWAGVGYGGGKIKMLWFKPEFCFCGKL
jgi:hypothetical protein